MRSKRGREGGREGRRRRGKGGEERRKIGSE